MNTIVIEFCPEDRARLDKIIAGLDGVMHDCSKCVSDAISVMENNTAEPVKQSEEEPTTPEQVTPPEEKAEEVAQEPQSAREYTKTDVRHQVTVLIGQGKKAQARDVIKRYADCIDNLPEDKLPEIMERLHTLEG